MASKRSCTRRKQYYRLLKTFFTLVFSLVTITASSQVIGDLQFNQSGDFSIQGESEFTISLVGISPSDIEIGRTNLPSSTVFVSSTKRDGFLRQTDGSTEKATTITYTLQFLEAGTYTLGSLPVIINGRSNSINFPTVRVFQNPDLLYPELYIEQIGSFYSLHSGEFTVLARYVKSVEDVSIDLSENALIEQIALNVELPSANFVVSDDAIALATFSCIPFSEGTLTLPKITVTCIRYDGERTTISLENSTVHVLPQNAYSSTTYGQERSVFADANQIEASVQNTVKMEVEKNEDLTRKLADLRIQEKYSAFSMEATRDREAIEKAENLQNGREVSFFWASFILLFSFVLIFVGIGFFVLQKKKNGKKYSYICYVLAALLLGGVIFYGNSLVHQYALTCGTYLYAIPEYESQVTTTLYAGTKVKIQRSVGEWYLVSQADGRTGWVVKDNCILIDNK